MKGARQWYSSLGCDCLVSDITRVLPTGEDSNRSFQRNDRGTRSAKAVMILNHILYKYYMYIIYIDIDIYHTYASAYPSASYLSASFQTFYEPLK